MIKEIREKQLFDDFLKSITAKKGDSEIEDFMIDDEGSVKFRERWCVPNSEELKENILNAAHHSPYYVHHGVDKLYKDIKRDFLWPNMKKKVVEFV